MLNWATFTTPTEKSWLHTAYGTNSLIMRAYRGLRPSHMGCNPNKWRENVRIWTLHTEIWDTVKTKLHARFRYREPHLSRETWPVPGTFQWDRSRLPYKCCASFEKTEQQQVQVVGDTLPHVVSEIVVVIISVLFVKRRLVLREMKKELVSRC